jgi:hypothetical protein
MKIRVKLGIAAAFVLFAATGLGLEAGAQDPINVVPANFPDLNHYWAMNKGGFQDITKAKAGQWAQVINVTPRWIVVEDEDGRQYPIAADRVRQFLIRWPSSTALLSNASMVEVTGPDGGSNVIVAEHLDQYEGDAQSLVAPTVNNYYNNYGFNYNYGYSQTLSPWNVAPMTTFQSTYYGMPFGYSAPLPLHVVGRALANDPVRIAGNGDNWYTVQPSASGMTVTQVTIGNNTYARRGDLVYLVLDNMSPRSLDVAQLVLYKKIPLRSFQP